MSEGFGILLLSATSLAIAATALLIERLLGYPNGLQDWVGHPVNWMGKLIGHLDETLNTGESRKLKGLVALLITLCATLAVTVPIALWLRSFESGWIGEALLASTLLSQKSLEDHVRAVSDGLAKSLKAGREAVRHIVGRDPSKLDRSGIAKGALESLAENTSDGVAAPLFWLIIGGLPGMALYKAINTADSMVGYRSDRYNAFGWASARLDDLVNLVPARVTGWLFVLSAALLPGLSGKGAFATMARDAKRHVSPNAGWPEAALAGALGIRLGGPRSYEGRKVDLAWMGDGREKLDRRDIENGLRFYSTALNVLTALVIAACVTSWLA